MPNTQKSGEDRICPNCGKGYYVKPVIAKDPKRGKYCSNKCQHQYRTKLGLPNAGAFKPKPKYCATCNKEVQDKTKKYCSPECKPAPKGASEFTVKRKELKKKGVSQFKWHESCGVCKKQNQTYYVSVTAKTCKRCHNKRVYKNRVSEKNYIKNRSKMNLWRINKSAIDPAYKIQQNMRSRVSKIVKEVKTYKNGSFVKMFGCSKKHLIKHFESKFTSKMTWDNYGTYWHVDHIIPISSFDLTDPEQCKQANHWTNLQPLEAKRNIAKSNKIVAPQMNLMLNL